MGYTHYWEQPLWGPKDQAGYEKVLLAVEEIVERHKDLLRYESNSDEPPEVSLARIRFNGIEDDGHETFLFVPGRVTFTFCKTARKPYDRAVCEVLAVLAYECPSLEVTSDGLGDDELDGAWPEALQAVHQEYGAPLEVANGRLVRKAV